jgi:hypothetical protein
MDCIRYGVRSVGCWTCRLNCPNGLWWYSYDVFAAKAKTNIVPLLLTPYGVRNPHDCTPTSLCLAGCLGDAVFEVRLGTVCDMVSGKPLFDLARVLIFGVSKFRQ